MSSPTPVNTGDIVVMATVVGSDLVARLPMALYPRELTRIAISGPTSAAFVLYRGQIMPSNTIDSTPIGTQNVAEYPIPIRIPAMLELNAVWPNATGAASATFHLTPSTEL